MTDPAFPTSLSQVAPQHPDRREFIAQSAAIGLAALAGTAHARELDVVPQDVTIPMANGHCDAFLVRPVQGRHPGVLIWTDVFGLRGVYRNFAQRLASSGYTVLVPNPFYRVAAAPLYTDVSQFDFSNTEARSRLMKPMEALMGPGIPESDARTYLDFLASQPSVLPDHGMGVHGYCMGGPLAIRTGAANPDRISAIASFHGGGLVTDKPDSPHRLAGKLHAKVYLGIAESDDKQQPEAKDALREAFAQAHLDAKIEVYPAPHGWCVPDMPMRQGQPTYRQDQAERAWAELLALYHTGLA